MKLTNQSSRKSWKRSGTRRPAILVFISTALLLALMGCSRTSPELIRRQTLTPPSQRPTPSATLTTQSPAQINPRIVTTADDGGKRGSVVIEGRNNFIVRITLWWETTLVTT
jgi:hypothetical protein